MGFLGRIRLDQKEKACKEDLHRLFDDDKKEGFLLKISLICSKSMFLYFLLG